MSAYSEMDTSASITAIAASNLTCAHRAVHQRFGHIVPCRGAAAMVVHNRLQTVPACSQLLHTLWLA